MKEFTIKIEFVDCPGAEDAFMSLLDDRVRYAEFMGDMRVEIESIVVEFLQREIDRGDLEVDIY